MARCFAWMEAQVTSAGGCASCRYDHAVVAVVEECRVDVAHCGSAATPVQCYGRWKNG